MATQLPGGMPVWGTSRHRCSLTYDPPGNPVLPERFYSSCCPWRYSCANSRRANTGTCPPGLPPLLQKQTRLVLASMMVPSVDPVTPVHIHNLTGPEDPIPMPACTHCVTGLLWFHNYSFMMAVLHRNRCPFTYQQRPICTGRFTDPLCNGSADGRVNFSPLGV